MKKHSKIIAGVLAMGALAAILTGCSSDADTASYNLSQEAEQFRVTRHITAINGITDNILLEVVGRCSVESANSALKGSLELTCKVGEDQYFKNYITLSDNTVVVVEQVETRDVSVYHYEWIVKPEGLIPDIRVETGQQ